MVIHESNLVASQENFKHLRVFIVRVGDTESLITRTRHHCTIPNSRKATCDGRRDCEPCYCCSSVIIVLCADSFLLSNSTEIHQNEVSFIRFDRGFTAVCQVFVVTNVFYTVSLYVFTSEVGTSTTCVACVPLFRCCYASIRVANVLFFYLCLRIGLCAYSGYKIYPGHGKTMIKADGKVYLNFET